MEVIWFVGISVLVLVWFARNQGSGETQLFAEVVGDGGSSGCFCAAMTGNLGQPSTALVDGATRRFAKLAFNLAGQLD
jgi:hypothetical protein